MFNGRPDNVVVDSEYYCPKCGNTGILPITGEPCDCIYATRVWDNAISCLDVPKQYLGKKFSMKLVPGDCGESYPLYLQKLYNDITTMKLHNYNCLICSPIAHAKTVLAYSIMETLFRNNIPTFPVCTVMEIHHILHVLDTCSDEEIDNVANPKNVTKAPYIFIKIPMMLSWEVYPTILDILDRRVRRGLCTIFIYDGYWDDLIKIDKRNILLSLRGDGYFSTIDVHNFYKSTDGTDEAKFKQLIQEFN